MKGQEIMSTEKTTSSTEIVSNVNYLDGTKTQI